MRTQLSLGGCLVFLLAGAVACEKEADTVAEMVPEKPQYFATQDEAIQKAIADFRAVLTSGTDIELGIDVETLTRTQHGRPVRRVELDFDKLLEVDAAATFEQLVGSERNLVIPLIADQAVATIVEVARDEGGWRVVGLAGQDIAGDLSAVLAIAGDSAESVTLYEVPNLQVRVYGVTSASGETLHTNYGDRFDIRKGIDAAALLPVLRADAQEFQRKYGDALRKGKLVR